MSTFTVFHTYSINDSVTAANLNGNISALVTAGNSIDRTNLAGGTGIDASSMNPSTAAAATFGGAQQYSFLNGLAVTGAVTMNGTNSFVGATTAGAEIYFTGTTVTAGAVAIGGDNGATKGMLLNVPTGSTNGFQFQVNGVTKVQVANTGALTTQAAASIGGVLQASPTINATTTLGPVPPGYTGAGAALAGTWHYVTGTTGSVGASGSTTITLTNNAVFASLTSYSVAASYTDALGINTPYTVTNVSGTQFTIKNNDATNAHTFAWVASGT
jgi:hypothetical protein